MRSAGFTSAKRSAPTHSRNIAATSGRCRLNTGMPDSFAKMTAVRVPPAFFALAASIAPSFVQQMSASAGCIRLPPITWNGWAADHIVNDLKHRFDEVLAELESVSGWKTLRIKRPVLILGGLDGIETGISQLIRDEPLETETINYHVQNFLLIKNSNHMNQSINFNPGLKFSKIL